MASPFLFLIRRPFQTTTPLSLCLGFSTALILSQPLLRPRLAYCDSLSPIARPSSPISESLHDYTRDAKVPIFLDGWRPNPAAYRQISAGSILGLVGGVAVSMFSRTLAIVFGLAVLGVQVSQLQIAVSTWGGCPQRGNSMLTQEGLLGGLVYGEYGDQCDTDD